MCGHVFHDVFVYQDTVLDMGEYGKAKLYYMIENAKTCRLDGLQ